MPFWFLVDLRVVLILPRMAKPSTIIPPIGVRRLLVIVHLVIHLVIVSSMLILVDTIEDAQNIMFVKSQNKDKHALCTIMRHLETLESFKYLGFEILSNHRWDECVNHTI